MAATAGREQSVATSPGGSVMTSQPSVEEAVLRVELRSLRTEMDLRFNALDEHLLDKDKALDLQAREYERRLLDLNNSHEKAIQVQSTYVNKDALALEINEIKRRLDAGAEAVAKLVIDMTRLTAAAGQIATDLSSITASQTWLTRIVIGAVILAVVGYVLGGSHPTPVPGG